MTERWRERLGGLDTLDPTPGLWERATTRSAEGPFRELRPDRRRRVVAATVAAVVAAAGLTGAFLAFTRPGTTPGESGLTTYRDPAGWEISYPDRFSEGTIPQPTFEVHESIEGIWVTNYGQPGFEGNFPGPAPAQPPDDGVLVEVYQGFGLTSLPQQPDTSFPISAGDLQVVPGDYPGVFRQGDVVANGDFYAVTLRIGPAAGDGDRQAAMDIISSLRFPPLQEGTVTGGHGQIAFYVLAAPDSFPVGSVTLFDDTNLPTSEFGKPFPFYLLRVPQGFYALAWPQDFSGGYKDCDVTFDPATRTFSCPNGASWALDGSVIAKPAPGLQDDPLDVLAVRFSLDGHVLVSPNVFMHDTRVDLQVTGEQ